MKDCIEINLTDEESDQVRSGLNSIAYRPNGEKNYVSAIRIAAYRYLPDRIINLLEKQKSSKEPASSLIFNNLPIDADVTGSPLFSQTGALFKSGNLSENVICAFGAVMGEPYSIYFEGRELVNNLTPQKNTANDYSGLGSEVELDFHIENAALKYMSDDDCSPYGMFLLGIRKDDGGINPKTFVADARKAIKLLSNEDIEILRGNNFIIRLPYRWRDAFSGGSENTDLCPMISGSIDLPRVSAVFYPDMVLPVNDKAKKSFDTFYSAIKSVSKGIVISPGKLVYIDNRFSLHSREKFAPTYDSNGMPFRWVQRLFIAPNLWGFRNFPSIGERVFNPGVAAA